MATSLVQLLRARVVLVLASFLLLCSPSAANLQIYRTGQSGADAQGNIIWFPQTIVSMRDSSGQYFDLEFEADGDLTMYDDHSHVLWTTNTGGHDCSKYCALRWTVDGRLQILVETQRGPQPIWQTNTFGDSAGTYLTFGATVPFVAVYTHNYTMVYSQTGDNSGPDLLTMCNSGAANCYNCDAENCLSGGNDGTQGSDVLGDSDNQPGFSG